MSEKLTIKDEKSLIELEDISRLVRAEILKMKPANRKRAYSVIGKMTEPNCWWLTYDMRDVFRKLINDAGMASGSKEKRR